MAHGRLGSVESVGSVGLKRLRRLVLAVLLGIPAIAYGGGPRYVAGVSFFDAGVKGHAVHWTGGLLRYFVDQGPLNSSIDNLHATAMLDAAAEVWNAVPTAAVYLQDAGNLAEDVNGLDIVAGNGLILQPADVTASVVGRPLGVVFDADGSVIDALFGADASQPGNCSQNGVLVWIDGINSNATMSHAILLVNGRCATSGNLVAMMQFQLERAFGRVLGLDYSQVNDGALGNTNILLRSKLTRLRAVTRPRSLGVDPDGALAWPVMQPMSGACGPAGGTCIPNPGTLQMDDIAALNRLYPVTAANLGSFPGKVLTAANTVSIQGTIRFRNGIGMQGVNVVVRPLAGSGNRLDRYTVSTVSGTYFAGNHGNPVTGWVDANNKRLDNWGGDDVAMQGFFDLSGIPLPLGMTMSSYQVTFEAVNPQYIGVNSVGPYGIGSPTPSGRMPTLTLSNLSAGSVRTLTVQVADSASGPVSLLATKSSGKIGIGAIPSRVPGALASEGSPQPLPASGAWTSRLPTVGASDWFVMPVRANRLFTLVAEALDEAGIPSSNKAKPTVGVWDGFDSPGSAAAGWAPAGNGYAPGETWLQVATDADEIIRIGIADQRGDGRPDYIYRGWVLYADSVAPARLPLTGGEIVIRGIGFRNGDTVRVGGATAQVTSILPNRITAIVAPSGMSSLQATGARVATAPTGSVDVEVDDLPIYNALAVIPGGLSYDSGAGDALKLVIAPEGPVPMNVPQPFSVLALDLNGVPVAGVAVVYSTTGGASRLECGGQGCTVTTTGDGRATLLVTATNTSPAIVVAALTNGANAQAHFYGSMPPVLSALTPMLHVAGGATVSWPAQVLVLSGGNPVAGQLLTWRGAPGVVPPATATSTNGAGIATGILAVGPLAEGQTSTAEACIGSSPCVGLSAFGARAEYASLVEVSGTKQSLSARGTAAPVVLRVLDMDGNSMASGTVQIHEALYAWTPVCPVHGRCAQAALLGARTTTLTSDLDGLVTLQSLARPGVPTRLVGLASTGNAGSLSFTVEQIP